MKDVEKARARHGATQAASAAATSADRQRMWAGLNRYLASELEHSLAADQAETEQTGEEKSPARPA
ncbi:MAG: hypothetical protein ABIQ15_10380 [Nocardioides sp.]